MDLVSSVALRAGLLVYCLVVPGWALLRIARFSSSSKLDGMLACLAAGAAATSLTVTTLLLVGLYFRPVVVVLLLLPLLFVVQGSWFRRSPEPASELANREPLNVELLNPEPFNPIDRAVIVAAAGFLAVYLLDAWTSPITWWDGLASWGKWAADWGRRSSSAHYVVGGYPQLVPRIVSVMYKMTGAHSAILPVDFFALHGVFVLFAAWFLIAAVRLSRLLGMPAWPVVLAGLGSMQFREHAGAGTVDVLVCAMVTTVLALYFGMRRGTWRAERAWLVLGAAAFAAIFTKWTGGVALLLLVMLDRASRAPYPLSPDRARAVRRTVHGALAVAAIGMLPFLIEQGASELRIGRWQSDPFEVNISLRQIPTLLSTDANLVYRGGDAGVRAGLVQLRFWNSYDVPATLRVVFTGFLFLCLAASVATWFGRATIPLLVVYGAIWLYWSSYDQRNIFGLLPVLALCASFGAARLWALAPRVLWANAIAVMAGLFLLLAGGGLLKDAQARIASLTRGDNRLGARLPAIRGGTDAKVALFYPQLEADYRFISALESRTHAAHVLITYPLFRFFERGAHALSLWPYELVQPGDVFAAHEYHTPPKDERWVFLARHKSNRVWLRVGELQPAAFRTASEGAGAGLTQGLYDVQPSDIGREGFAVWRGVATGAPAHLRATFTVESNAMLDPDLVSTVCEEPAPGVTVRSCSGIVALRPEAVASYRAGQLAVGFETDGAPSDVTLTVARPLAARDAQR